MGAGLKAVAGKLEGTSRDALGNLSAYPDPLPPPKQEGLPHMLNSTTAVTGQAPESPELSSINP